VQSGVFAWAEQLQIIGPIVGGYFVDMVNVIPFWETTEYNICY
jgi:Na+/glutamate symporter